MYIYMQNAVNTNCGKIQFVNFHYQRPLWCNMASDIVKSFEININSMAITV